MQDVYISNSSSVYTPTHTHTHTHTTKNINFLMSACSPIIFCARVFSIKIRLHLEQFNSGEELKALKSLCLPETCPSSLK